MALSTPLDIITLALRTSGAIGVGQTPLAEDTNDAFDVLNTILTEWQLNRWLVYDLVEAIHTATGAVSYTVGPTGDFVFTGQRPDKIDAVFARLISSSADTYLYPYMSRESYDRVISKSTAGIPYAFFYDPGLTSNGTIYLYPAPSASYSIHVQGKASLGQFATLEETITLPKIYITALLWNLSAELRPIFQLPADQQITTKAVATLQSAINSIAQIPQAVSPTQSNRAGIFSQMAETK